MLVYWATILFLQLSKAFANNNPGYQYSYYVRDVNTGDYKTQEESRVGDTVRGSYTVGEPNGDLRVVTYHADKNTGFNAQVQVQPGGVQMSNSDSNQQPFYELMKSAPRYQKRTGFPQLEIKVVPPLSQLFQNKPTIMAPYKSIEQVKNEGNEKTLDVVSPEILPTTTDQTIEETTKEMVFNEIATTMNVADVNETAFLTDDKNREDLKLNKESNDYKEHLCEVICKQKPEEEGRAYQKPVEDKVKVEMEQATKAEAPEPTGVNVGLPNEQLQYHRQHYFQGNPVKYKPLEQSAPTKNFNVFQQTLPHYFQNKLFLLPFNMNMNSHEYPVHQQSSQLTKDEEYREKIPQHKPNMQSPHNYPPQIMNHQKTNIAHIYPVYTTGLAFLVVPRMQ